jgi:hypothetical protein
MEFKVPALGAPEGSHLISSQERRVSIIDDRRVKLERCGSLWWYDVQIKIHESPSLVR